MFSRFNHLNTFLLCSLLLMCGASLNSTLHAQVFKIDNQQYFTNDPTIQGALEQTVNSLVSEVNQLFAGYNFSPFITAMGRSYVNSTHGTQYSYGSAPSLFDVGVSLGVAYEPAVEQGLIQLLQGDLEIGPDNQVPGVGLGLNVNMWVGFKLGVLDSFIGDIIPSIIEPLFITINALYVTIPNSISIVRGNLLNIGINVQYPILKPISLPLGLLKWKGLYVGTGINYHSYNLVLQSFQIPSVSTGSVEGISTSWAGDIRLGTSQKQVVIPFDISTGMQILHFLGLYTGLSLEFIAGRSVLVTESVSEIESTLNGNKLYSANATLDLGTSQRTTPVLFRPFIGIQFDLLVISLFIQASYEVIEKGFALQLGFKGGY